MTVTVPTCHYLCDSGELGHQLRFQPPRVFRWHSVGEGEAAQAWRILIGRGMTYFPPFRQMEFSAAISKLQHHPAGHDPGSGVTGLNGTKCVTVTSCLTSACCFPTVRSPRSREPEIRRSQFLIDTVVIHWLGCGDDMSVNAGVCTISFESSSSNVSLFTVSGCLSLGTEEVTH